MKVKYLFEAHQGDGAVEAESDQEALDLLRKRFGEELFGVMYVYVEESEYHSRTVWIE